MEKSLEKLRQRHCAHVVAIPAVCKSFCARTLPIGHNVGRVVKTMRFVIFCLYPGSVILDDHTGSEGDKEDSIVIPQLVRDSWARYTYAPESIRLGPVSLIFPVYSG